MADLEVRHNEKFHRFEAGEPSNLAKLNYHPAATAVEMVHVEVPPEYQGQGLAGKLAEAALNWARQQNLKVIPSCPYVKGYLGKHPEYSDLL